MSLEMDKCTEQFTFRIPEILRCELDKFSRHQKSELIEALIITMAQEVHRAKFQPEIYIKTDYMDNQ